MGIQAPKSGIWLTSLILGALGALINLDIVDMSISFVDLDLGFWLMMIAWLILLIAALIKK
jgi:hypothetical protein